MTLNSEKVKPIVIELCLSKGIQQLIIENSIYCSDALKAFYIDLKAYFYLNNTVRLTSGGWFLGDVILWYDHGLW